MSTQRRCSAVWWNSEHPSAYKDDKTGNFQDLKKKPYIFLRILLFSKRKSPQLSSTFNWRPRKIIIIILKTRVGHSTNFTGTSLIVFRVCTFSSGVYPPRGANHYFDSFVNRSAFFRWYVVFSSTIPRSTTHCRSTPVGPPVRRNLVNSHTWDRVRRPHSFYVERVVPYVNRYRNSPKPTPGAHYCRSSAAGTRLCVTP